MQSKRARGEAGQPLPVVFQALEDNDTRFLRGQFGLIAAGPGVGKSITALTIALKTRIPSLYFSADSDAFTQLTRSLCVLTGMTQAEAGRAVLEDRLDEIRDPIEGHPIRFSYEASPSQDTIKRTVDAYWELYGEYPALIVIDNVTNVRMDAGGEDDDPFSGLEGLMDYLHDMARKTNACVLGLHHVTGPYNDANKPVPLSGIKGQISRVPELILTVHKQEDEGQPTRLCISTVKNRAGKADPSGQSFVELEFEGERMKIVDTDLSPMQVQEPVDTSFQPEVAFA